MLLLCCVIYDNHSAYSFTFCSLKYIPRMSSPFYIPRTVLIVKCIYRTPYPLNIPRISSPFNIPRTFFPLNWFPELLRMSVPLNIFLTVISFFIPRTICDVEYIHKTLYLLNIFRQIIPGLFSLFNISKTPFPWYIPRMSSLLISSCSCERN